MLKRIDYGGSATLLVMVQTIDNCRNEAQASSDALLQVLSFLVFLSMRFSEEYPVLILVPLCLSVPSLGLTNVSPETPVVLPSGLRPPHLRARVRAAVRVRRAAARARADPRALPPQGAHPRPRGREQLLRRDVQLYGHVQLSDVVPDGAVDQCERGWCVCFFFGWQGVLEWAYI